MIPISPEGHFESLSPTEENKRQPTLRKVNKKRTLASSFLSRLREQQKTLKRNRRKELLSTSDSPLHQHLFRITFTQNMQAL
jgi:hypothetical protein